MVAMYPIHANASILTPARPRDKDAIASSSLPVGRREFQSAKEIRDETVFLSGSLLALPAYRVAGSGPTVRARAGRRPRQEDQGRERFPADQPQGPGARAGAR